MTQQFGLDDFLKHIKNKPDDDNSNKSNNSASNRSALSNNPGLYFENRVSSKSSDKANKEEKISAQMQKRINDFFKSDEPSEPQQRAKGLLDKKAFVFIPFEPDLDKKKIDALTERIRRNGGITFRVDFYDWKPSTSLDVYIVVTKEMSFQVLMDTIPTGIHERLNKFVFINWRWITDCLRDRELLDVGSYIIDWRKVKEAENAKRLEQIMKEEEEAKRKEQNEREMIIGDNDDEVNEVIPANLANINEKRGYDELKRAGSKESVKLFKAGEEEQELEEIEKPKKKLKIRENEEVMETYRYLYDYRLGIEDEDKYEDEPEPEPEKLERKEDIMEIEDSPEKAEPAKKVVQNPGRRKPEELFVPRVEVKSPPIRVVEELQIPRREVKSPPRKVIEKEVAKPKIEHREETRSPGKMMVENLSVPRQEYREENNSKGSSRSRGGFEEILSSPSPRMEERKEVKGSGKVLFESLSVPRQEYREENNSRGSSRSRGGFEDMYREEKKSLGRIETEQLKVPKQEYREENISRGSSRSKGGFEEILSSPSPRMEERKEVKGSGKVLFESLSVPRQEFIEDSSRGSSRSRGDFEDIMISPREEVKSTGRMDELRVPKIEEEQPKSPRSPSRNAFDMIMGKNKGPVVKNEHKETSSRGNAFDMIMGRGKGGEVKTEHKDETAKGLRQIRDKSKGEEEAKGGSIRRDEVHIQTNLNQHLTDEFEKLLKVYITKKDKGRMHAYRNGIAAIKSVPFRIENADQVKGVAGIGTKIRDKINEILATGQLKKAVELTDEKQTVINLLTKVWGVGSQTATSLYEKGIKDIETLRKHAYLLNDNQRVGLKYFEDFEQRIPREEIGGIVQIITEKVNELAGGPGIYDVTCCGSYRRGKATCGDIDILMSRADGKPFDGFLNRVVRGLENSLITDHLTRAKMSPMGSETYMGVLKYNGIHRRIDMKIYPHDQYGYAVLYFTGSDQFNRTIRLVALKNGLSLSDHGLSRVEKTEKGQKMIPENIPCYTEHEVFDVVGVRYKPPEEREV